MHLELKGMVASISTRHFLLDSEKGNVSSAEEIGQQLARRLLKNGAAQLIAEARV
jgi:porphobilinogen deaminase